MHNEGYRTVRDLLEDVYEADFRSDLHQWGLRKRFLNEVHHRLKDMAHAFEVLAEQPSPKANASNRVGPGSTFSRPSPPPSSTTRKPIAAPQLSQSPKMGLSSHASLKGKALMIYLFIL